MSCFYPVLIVLVGGCYTLPLPSSITMVWSVQDNIQDQASLLCLVQGMSNVGVTVWSANDNETNVGSSLESRFNIISTAILRPSITQLFFLQYGSTVTHILIPLSKKGLRSLLSTRSLETQRSSNPSSESLPIIILPASPNVHLSYRLAFSEDVSALIIHSPFSVGLGSLIFPPIFNEDKYSPSKQDFLDQIRLLVATENLLSFALLSLPTDHFRSSESVACFVPDTGFDDVLDSQEVILPEEAGHFNCNEEEFPEELALHMRHDLLLLLTIRIIVFKLLIFDLLMTCTAILQTRRNVTQEPKCMGQ